MQNSIEIALGGADGYELLDSGNKYKLERVGNYTIVRSEPRAWWEKTLSQEEWDKAVAVYEREDKGAWAFKEEIPESFDLSLNEFTIKAKFTKTSKHLGFFPEQSAHWEWMSEKIRSAGREVNVLNLFGYTGLGTFAAAKAGAKVTHVDASKAVVEWARENQTLSGLTEAPIRWIVDDAMKFVRREANRGVLYDAIILDPPAFGRGFQGQVWKIERDLPALLAECKKVLSPQPLFVILTSYAIDASSLSLKNLVADLMKDHGGTTTAGELALPHTSSDKLLPLSIYASWSA